MEKKRAKVIVITGTPGVGKSTLAQYLKDQFGWRRLDLHRYYQQIATRYDRHKQCYVLNFNKVKKLVAQIRDESDTPLVVDSHIAHHLHQNLVDLCIVLTCSDLQKLKKRLQKRRYSTAKIEENLQAEIFQVCLEEAREQKHKILLFNKLSRENIARRATIIKKSSNERRGRHLESAVAH